MLDRPYRLMWAATVVCLAALAPVAAQEPNLTEEQIHQSLAKVKIMKSKNTPKGITSPWRLTLSDGQLTHDAAYQSINETQRRVDFPSGNTEFNFRDSYHFNIAAHEIDNLWELVTCCRYASNGNGEARVDRFAGGSPQKWMRRRASRTTSNPLTRTPGISKSTKCGYSVILFMIRTGTKPTC